jgi:glutaredoxin
VSPPEVTLLGRPGCHLCEEAMAVLEALRSELGFAAFQLRTVDIEADDATFKAYLERIPVVALDGQELYDFFVDREDLRRRLLRRPAS